MSGKSSFKIIITRSPLIEFLSSGNTSITIHGGSMRYTCITRSPNEFRNDRDIALIFDQKMEIVNRKSEHDLTCLKTSETLSRSTSFIYAALVDSHQGGSLIANCCNGFIDLLINSELTLERQEEKDQKIDRKVANQIISILEIEQKIDLALSSGNKELFLQLSEELNKIKGLPDEV